MGVNSDMVVKNVVYVLHYIDEFGVERPNLYPPTKEPKVWEPYILAKPGDDIPKHYKKFDVPKVNFQLFNQS